MEPIKFNEMNGQLNKPKSMTDDECGPLYVHSDGVQLVSCWKMTFKERIAALLYGKVWLGVVSGTTQPPVWLTCRKTVFEKK